MKLLSSISIFRIAYPSDAVCLEEIKRHRFPKGVFCHTCRKVTKHYRLNTRPVYICKFCRRQLSPLTGTIFEKTTTPLRLWFYCMYLMIATGNQISAKQLQRELGVTYKTAWRMKNVILRNNEDLLNQESNVHKWLFFNKLEFKVAEKRIES